LAPNSPEEPSSGTVPVIWLDTADRPLSLLLLTAQAVVIAGDAVNGPSPFQLKRFRHQF
jgi:hypothetical protein